MDNKFYNEEFYRGEGVDGGSYKSAQKILPPVFDILRPKSVVDFGCGTGAFLKVAETLGAKDIQGIDFGDNSKSLLIKPEQFLRRDLTSHIDLKRKYDLVMTIEVAEHLPEANAADFVATLCRHGDIVLFSAAIPHQGGVNHINEQFLSYWKKIFDKYDYQMVDYIRPVIWDDDSIEKYYHRQNMTLFISKTREDLINAFTPPPGGQNGFIDLVHYQTFFEQVKWREALERQVLDILGFSINQALTVLESCDNVPNDLLIHYDPNAVAQILNSYDPERQARLRRKIVNYYKILGREREAKLFA